MSGRYILGRIGVFLLTVWLAATLNFAVPRLTLQLQGLIRPSQSVEIWLAALEGESEAVQRSPALRDFQQRFGFDQDLATQYIRYLWATARFQFGYSLALFPAKVMDVIRIALPYTLGLMVVATALSFTLGLLGGGLFMWRGTPRLFRALMSLSMAMAPIPYYLMALILLYVLAYQLDLFPIGGARAIGSIPSFDVQHIMDILYHGTLPALSIVLCSIGRWALRTRGSMVSVLGEDYLTLAEAKGLKRRWIFLNYAMRNAMLPQLTNLAISLRSVASGAVLVEMIFAYPGMGRLLYRSIVNVDITLTQGITYILVLTTAAGTLIIDLIYPRFDPRITYGTR
ncbi:MAG: ABC transporter permease [Anaerolineae bacterium]